MPSEEIVVSIGPEDGDHLSLKFRPLDAKDEELNPWIPSTVLVSAGAFQAHAEAGMLASDIARFRHALASLRTDPKGRASLETDDGWLSVRLFGDGFGHFDARCELRDPEVVLHRLEFTIGLNERDLPDVLAGVEAILARAAPGLC